MSRTFVVLDEKKLMLELKVEVINLRFFFCLLFDHFATSEIVVSRMKKYTRINIFKMSENFIKKKKKEDYDAINFKIKMKRIFIDNNSTSFLIIMLL